MDIKKIVLVCALALVAPARSWAQSPSGAPWFGTWVSGPTTLTMTPWEDGIQLVEVRTAEGAPPTRGVAFGRMDGLIYPRTGAPSQDGLIFTKVDDRTYEYAGTKDGKVVSRSVVTFPLDGITRISHATLTNGEPVDRKTVWKRKQVPGPDPWYGTWQTGTTTFIMEPWEDGFLVSFTRVPANAGDTGSHGSIFGRFDGRRYRETGSASVDYVVFKRIDARTIALVHFKDDKETVTVTMAFSPDGKTRTSTTTGVEPDGTAVNRTVTWTRVEP